MKFLIAILWLSLSFAVAGPVSYYGKLQASGNKIVGSKTGSTAVQLRGVSFGWSNPDWESGRFYRSNAVDAMVNDWKSEVVRAAYGSTSLAFSNQTANDNRVGVERVVDKAILNDVYVIIDWHSHNAESEVQNSKDFFDYMAKKYGDKENVIFEIYNEPLNISWQTVKDYADQIIPVIRAHSSNLILVGTPQWSQKVGDPVSNKINDANVGYVFHFYAYTHRLSNFQNNVNTALNGNLPVFVTEWGTVHSDGGQSDKNHYDTHDAQSSDEWHSFMDQNKISSAAWEVNDKYAGACFFGIQGAARKFDMASWADKTKMTPSGQYIFDKLNAYYQTAPWKNGPSPIKPLAVNLQDMGDASVEIFSLQGKKLGTGHSISDLNLKSGTYILLVRQGSQTKALKIVKK